MKLILTLALVVIASTGMAQNRNVDVEIFGIKEKVPLTPTKSGEGIKADNPSWVEGDTRQYYLCAFGGPVLDEWTPFEFSFMPEEDGMVTLYLKGPFFDAAKANGGSPIWVAYDNLVVTGAEVENPDFENVLADTQLEGWKNARENFVTASEGAQSGKNYVKVTHDVTVAQDIQVKKGQEVTIQFQVKAVPETQ